VFVHLAKFDGSQARLAFVGAMLLSSDTTQPNRVTCGLATERRSMASWCWSKAIYVSSDQRGRKTSAIAAGSTSMAWSMGAQG
jgi:hypothetical protein